MSFIVQAGLRSAVVLFSVVYVALFGTLLSLWVNSLKGYNESPEIPWKLIFTCALAVGTFISYTFSLIFHFFPNPSFWMLDVLTTFFAHWPFLRASIMLFFSNFVLGISFFEIEKYANFQERWGINSVDCGLFEQDGYNICEVSSVYVYWGLCLGFLMLAEVLVTLKSRTKVIYRSSSDVDQFVMRPPRSKY
ncbi:hypothetical protein BGW38_001765 [Lunasporangiospora selenospora]|uniref:Uncharacterized protein n=1 Tax=Lunasporangiospora selenospora TaxID=979761 RepID=A0A9P6KDX5_9FUNG|nr:hypothetical protein BGW38_001765 [Lunasporangiospora selenospora]